MNGIKKYAQDLINQVSSAAELKQLSVALETLAQSKSFKSEAKHIANDDHLTPSLKKREILALIQEVRIPVLQNFFTKLLSNEEYWIFGTDKFDYFDDFVQAFQLMTEELTVMHLVTAVELKEKDLDKLATDVSESLGKKVIVHCQVDPKILGGSQVRLGNLVFDYSLRSKFLQFQRQWTSKLEKTSRLIGHENIAS